MPAMIEQNKDKIPRIMLAMALPLLSVVVYAVPEVITPGIGACPGLCKTCPQLEQKAASARSLVPHVEQKMV